MHKRSKLSTLRQSCCCTSFFVLKITCSSLSLVPFPTSRLGEKEMKTIRAFEYRQATHTLTDTTYESIYTSSVSVQWIVCRQEILSLYVFRLESAKYRTNDLKPMSIPFVCRIRRMWWVTTMMVFVCFVRTHFFGTRTSRTALSWQHNHRAMRGALIITFPNGERKSMQMNLCSNATTDDRWRQKYFVFSGPFRATREISASENIASNRNPIPKRNYSIGVGDLIDFRSVAEWNGNAWRNACDCEVRETQSADDRKCVP